MGETTREFPPDLKSESQIFIFEQFSIDLTEYPKHWEKLYDLFKEAHQQGMDLGELIRNHLMGGQEISSQQVMDILIRVKEALVSLGQDYKKDSFPLERGVPLTTDIVIKGIGTIERQYSQEGNQDFPQKVIIKTRDGRSINTSLEQIYCDGSSQGDGTFYFSDRVREDDSHAKDNFLFGREIEGITFVRE